MDQFTQVFPFFARNKFYEQRNKQNFSSVLHQIIEIVTEITITVILISWQQSFLYSKVLEIKIFRRVLDRELFLLFIFNNFINFNYFC